MGGAVGGLVLGLVIGWASSSTRDSSFKSEEDVVRLLSLPVLAMVPMMASDEERAVGSSPALARDSVVAVVVVVASAAAVVFWRLQS